MLRTSGLAVLIVLAEVVSMDDPAEPISAAVLAAGVIGAARYGVLRRQSAAREKELLAEAAAAEERLRIARELHDAVGHDVSLMVVQAEALGAVTGDERADAIAALGRRTMGEMHRTLKVLREDAGLAPQPGLGDLGGVIEGRAAPACRSPMPSRARRAHSLPRSTRAPTGSCRRR
jgi:signal transduction histidine kinase